MSTLLGKWVSWCALCDERKAWKWWVSVFSTPLGGASTSRILTQASAFRMIGSATLPSCLVCVWKWVLPIICKCPIFFFFFQDLMFRCLSEKYAFTVILSFFFLCVLKIVTKMMCHFLCPIFLSKTFCNAVEHFLQLHLLLPFTDMEEAESNVCF